MTCVRVAVVLALLLLAWPLATPAGPAYARLLARRGQQALEGTLGLIVFLMWSLRRLGAWLFLRASGGRLRATSQSERRGD